MTTDIRARLCAWIEQHAAVPGPIRCDTDILGEQVLSSIEFTDLILFVEELRDEPLDAAQLVPDAFRTVDAMVRHFFGDGS